MRKNNAMGLWDMSNMIHCSFFIFFLGGLATLSFYRYNNQEATFRNIKVTLTNSTTNAIANNSLTNTRVSYHESRLKIKQPSLRDTCNLFSGRWVHDNSSHYPLYKEHECPNLEDTFACQTYGRKDSKYLQWRWQPHSCDFPRFDGKSVVESLRGKRLLFVGDSLNRNQWISMVCMLRPSIPGVKLDGGDTFRAIDYNISIDFYWAPMLVESNGDIPSDHHRDNRFVRIKAIEEKARHWVDADVLIFNSYHWWRLPGVKLSKSVGSVSLLDDPNQEYEEMDSLRAYKLALRTWSKWAHSHVDTSKTKLFFMGATATHLRAEDWGGKNQGNCYGETEPVLDDDVFRESGTNSQMLNILESTLRKLKSNGVNVRLINVTQLTQCRKDGHTTVYRKYWRPLSKLQKKNPAKAADCSHWCLPGVPDIWNELLLAYILQ
ncbi:trichome birefringence-like protein 34 [Tanacetum coccineum]